MEREGENLHMRREWKEKIWNDFIVPTGEYVGLVMEVNGVWVYVLTENVHSWLKKFGDFYVGFQHEKV